MCWFRMKKAEISCPEVVLLKKHILVMSFIGKDHVPAPKLKDVVLSSDDMNNAFYQVLHVRAILHLHVICLKTRSLDCRYVRTQKCD